jgi:hypothetical protein
MQCGAQAQPRPAIDETLSIRSVLDSLRRILGASGIVGLRQTNIVGGAGSLWVVLATQWSPGGYPMLKIIKIVPRR